MNHKLLTLVLAVAVIVSMVVVGCAKPTPAPTPTPTPQAEPIVLKWATHEPNGGMCTQELLKRFAELTEEKTEGRVKVEIYWGAVLGKLPDYLKMIGGAGVADGGFVIPTYHQWEIPLSAAAGLPFLSTGYRVPGKATWELYNEWPAMQKEWEKWNVKPLMALSNHPHWIVCKNPITTMEELNGNKMWVAGFWQVVGNHYGIINVKMTAAESYDALQKHMIVGVLGMPYHTLKIFKYYEVCKNFIDLEFAGGAPVNFETINLDVWNKISPADQKTIEEIIASLSDWYIAKMDAEDAGLTKLFEEQGVTFIEFSPEEQAKIRDETAELTWNDWIATAKEKGLPAEEFLKRINDKVAEVQSRS